MLICGFYEMHAGRLYHGGVCDRSADRFRASQYGQHGHLVAVLIGHQHETATWREREVARPLSAAWADGHARQSSTRLDIKHG